MKTVATFSTPTEAQLVIARLRSAGIETNLRDELTVTTDWALSNAVGGVKIEVADDDWEAAREILELPASEESLVHCPRCGSGDIWFRPIGALTAICFSLGLPFPTRKATVDCRSCKRSFTVPLTPR